MKLAVTAEVVNKGSRNIETFTDAVPFLNEQVTERFG
jgi:hypothetical protein